MVKPATVAEEALELAQWLGDGQGLLARLQELYGEMWLIEEVSIGGPSLKMAQSVGQLIREAVEHFRRMPR